MEDKRKKDVDLDEVEELDEDLDFDEIEELDEEETTTKKHADEEDFDEIDDDEFEDDEFDDEDLDDVEDEIDDDYEEEETKKTNKSEKESSLKETKKSKDDNKDELLEDEGESFGAKIVIAIVIIAIIIILLLKACGGKKEQFKVTFDTNGGTAVESLMVDKDGTFKRPKDPTKEGYIFAGWYYNDELYDFNTKVTGNMKLEARWDVADDGKVTGVTLNETAISLKPGATATLIATVTPETAEDKSLTWSSSDESIVTVDENGNIKAIKEGKATITVTTKDGGYKATVIVTVTKDDIAVTGVSFDNKTLNLATGSSTTLKATVSPSDATNKGLTWSSSDSSIATVDQNGKVTGKKEGTVTITVTTKDGNYKATITVVVKNEPVKSVKITGNTSMIVKGTQTLKAVITPNNATNKAVTWSSSDESIATVDQNGKVTAKKTGTVTITVTTKDGNHKATINITVKEQKVTKITISGNNKMEVGKTQTLKATVTPNNATNKGITWSSSDESIATVDQNGKVTAKKAGKVTITATAKDGSGVKGTYTITVTEKQVVYAITLRAEKDGLGTRTAYLIEAKADNAPLDYASVKIVYSGSGLNVDSVVRGNRIQTFDDYTPLNGRTATIKLKDGKEVTAKITVIN